MNNQTITAISTPNAVGGISIVRLSGDNALEIAKKLVSESSKQKLEKLSGYDAIYSKIFDETGLIDEAVILYFKAPHSYTGEDVVEISCHGGIFVTKQLLRATINAGAILAQAGEFTKRAFLNGKLDLTQAEAVCDLISAGGKSAHTAAVLQKEGNLSKKISLVSSALITGAAHLSAWIDFPEDDLPEFELHELKENINIAINELTTLSNSFDVGRILKNGVRTAIIGKTNVGKSTLMNTLSGFDRSIVTDIPGTTRDIIEETVMLNDVILLLSDTAGLRETVDPIERIGVSLSLKRIETAELIIAVFDGSSPLSEHEYELIEKLKDKLCVAVINKLDLDMKIELDFIKNNFKYVVQISAKDNSSLSGLQTAILDALNLSKIDTHSAMITSERQRGCVLNALLTLKQASEDIDSGVTLDAISVLIEEAVDFLLELTGERSSEQILDELFSHFCIGK